MTDEPLSAYVRRMRGQLDEGPEWLADRIAELEGMAASYEQGQADGRVARQRAVELGAPRIVPVLDMEIGTATGRDLYLSGFRHGQCEIERDKALAALKETDSWLWNKIINGVYGPVGD